MREDWCNEEREKQETVQLQTEINDDGRGGKEDKKN